jgi:hemoglobin-like flavoprotein
MTESQIEAVQRTWKIFRSIEPALVGDVFYSKLFMMQPELRKMFPASMDEQYKKILDTLSVMMARLDRLDSLTEDINVLAQRHTGYGVKPEHYRMVGQALLWTLEQGLGRDWTPDVELAWIECYTMLSRTMISVSGYHIKQ